MTNLLDLDVLESLDGSELFYVVKSSGGGSIDAAVTAAKLQQNTSGLIALNNLSDVADTEVALSNINGQPILAEGAFVDGDKTKLDSITGVTETSLLAAGALMDSEITNLDAVKTFDPTDYGTAADVAAKPDLGETSSDAYRGDYGKIAYDHSQNSGVHVPTNGTVNEGKVLTASATSGVFTWEEIEAVAGLQLGITYDTAYRGDYGNIAFNHSQSTYYHVPENTALDDGKVLTSSAVPGTYTWEVIESVTGLQLGETETTAYRGDHGLIAYTHSQDTSEHVPDNGTENEGKVLTAGAAAGVFTWEEIETVAGLQLGETDTTAYRGDHGLVAYTHSQDSSEHVPANGTVNEGKVLTASAVSGVFTWEEIETVAGLQLGETDTTAYRGDHGLIAYTHSQTDHAPSDATATNETNVVAAGESTFAKLIGANQVITTTEHKGYTEDLVDHGTIAGSGIVTMDWDEGPAHIITLGGLNVYIQTNSSGTPAAGSVGTKVIHLYGCDTYGAPDFPAEWITMIDFPTLENAHERLIIEYIAGDILLSHGGSFTS